MSINTIILRSVSDNNWLRFSDPIEVVDVTSLDEVVPVLSRIESHVNADNLYAAGFISYEASPAFDPSCGVKFDAGFPLLRFGLFAQVETLDSLDQHTPDDAIRWQMDSAPNYYAQKIRAVKKHIHAGDTYQVNFTVRQHSNDVRDAWSLFKSLGGDAPYAAYIECHDWAICCASPELFFALDGEHLVSRPMKGTASRGVTVRDDEEQKTWLRNSIKNRAENVMIVDMIRNDMGRVAKTGSVKVANLFRVETYPTALQMTSTVEAKTDHSVVDILRALFPCASITGAPKVNTMALIAALEDSPRRIYTGSIGYIAPQRKARFNVAIRTALVNQRTGHACYGCGGGIVWDSQAGDEFNEINIKSKILGQQKQRDYFKIFESLLWHGDSFLLLQRHVDRLLQSACYFDFPVEESALLQYLNGLSGTLPAAQTKVRLTLAANGALDHQLQPINTVDKPYFKVKLAPHPVDADSIWLAHKTTIRALYEEARAAYRDTDDVLLWNQRGFVTESSIANVALKLQRQWITPARKHGLLAGTFRAAQLADNKLTEGDLQIADLERAEDIYLLNSVRQWIKAHYN